MRLVDPSSGAGIKGCDVGLRGGPAEIPQRHWTVIHNYVRSAADGQVRFTIVQPLPEFLEVDAPYPCGLFGTLGLAGLSEMATPSSDVLATGVMGRMNHLLSNGKPYCHPNLDKLEKVQPKPGEIVLFVRKLSLLEKWIMAQ